MKEFAKDFAENYKDIKVEEVTAFWQDEDEDGNEIDVEEISYNITAIPGLEDLTLDLSDADEFSKLESIIELKPLLFPEFLAGKFDDTIEVILTKISKRIIPIAGPSRSIDIQINHLGLEAVVSISRAVSVTNIGFIADKMVGVRRIPYRYVATINGLKHIKDDELETTARSLLRSVLFDIEYTYDLAFELTNLSNLKSATRREHTSIAPLPGVPIRLMYKKYIPELIEYFHMGEKVDYLPFKYICYFHVLEYFMDKSAYSVVSRKLKQILISPDFHTKTSEYISTAVNIIKAETERNATDKIKIKRVIEEFTQNESIKSHLTSIGFITHFQKDHVLQCGKPLNVVGINFDSDASFCESVARRIYSIRCSIVHSNPEFDESKAVPFHPTEKNIDFLRTEIELIKEVARTIISNSPSM